MSISIETQKTLQREVGTSGKGIFTGESVSMRMCPAPLNCGIVFQRVDLPGKPEIPANLTHVRETPRCTRLATEKGSIATVEHLLSTLFAYGITNARIEVEGPEIPIGDGSAKLFVDLIEKAGIQTQEKKAASIQIVEPIHWSDGDIHLVALPSSEFRLSYTLHYPSSPLLRSQYYSYPLNLLSYKTEIAPCRTFALYEELLPLIEKGMLKGGGLENGLVIQGDKVLNPEGVRFQDEMVRHKILDLIGDLALIGKRLFAHVIAVRSGHASNIAFAKTLLKKFESA